MANWPSVQISAPSDDGALTILTFTQIGPAEITARDQEWSAGSDQSGAPDTDTPYDLFNCTASADGTMLGAQTKWWPVTVNVSIDLALVSPTEATVTINAEGAPTVHQISGQAYADATAFVASCRLPLIAPSFVVGRIKEPH